MPNLQQEVGAMALMLEINGNEKYNLPPPTYIDTYVTHLFYGCTELS